jgi:molybdopterin converting factor small subunit
METEEYEDVDVSEESAQLDEKYLTEYANDVLSMLGDLVGEDVEPFEEVLSPTEEGEENSYLNDFSKQIMKMLDSLLKEGDK